MSFRPGDQTVGIRLSCGTLALVSEACSAERGHLLPGCLCVRMGGTREVRLVYLPWLCVVMQWGSHHRVRFEGLSLLHRAAEFVALADWRTVTLCPHHQLFENPKINNP